MLKKILTFLLLITILPQLQSQKLSINGNKFERGGKEIFLSGLNSPWQDDMYYRIDFLGTAHFDPSYWTTQFQNMANNKVNFVRIWVHGRGNHTPAYDVNGFVVSPSQDFYDDLEYIINLAEQHKIYVLLTMWSFDMVLKSGFGQPGSNFFVEHRNTILDNNKTNSYLNNFLTPVVSLYKDNPYVLAYDIINEPETIWENSNDLVDGAINRNQVIAFVAKAAATIHQASNQQQFVTVGSKWSIYNSDAYTSYGSATSVGDNYTDASLQAQFNSSDAYLDFYSMHWYHWQSTGAPFDTPATSLHPGVTKPIIVGEYPGFDLPNNDCGCTCNTPTICDFNITIVQAYEGVRNNNFAGITAWRNASDADGFGISTKIYEATLAFVNNHPNLVVPQPDAHMGLAVSNDAGSSFTLDWDANENAIDGTNIFINEVGSASNAVYITTLAPGETTFDYSGTYGTITIQAGGSYELTLEALPDANQNAYSNTIASTTLPVELMYFEGENINGWNVLNWETASELNNEKFEIERSQNGMDFQYIGGIRGQGTSHDRQQYTFIDENINNRNNYYRLLQMDRDGSYEYSDIIFLKSKKENEKVGAFYPNPSQLGLLNLDYISKNNRELNISIYGITGKLIRNENRTISEGNNKLNFDFSKLGKGIYMVKIGNGINASYRKLIIE